MCERGCETCTTHTHSAFWREKKNIQNIPTFEMIEFNFWSMKFNNNCLAKVKKQWIRYFENESKYKTIRASSTTSLYIKVNYMIFAMLESICVIIMVFQSMSFQS